MKQLIARIDEALHRRLKEQAEAEGRSLNAFVTDALEGAVNPPDGTEALRERVRVAGMLDEPPPLDGDPPAMEEIVAMTRGAGSAFSEALEDIREPRS